jgi:hypothetical protein
MLKGRRREVALALELLVPLQLLREEGREQA